MYQISYRETDATTETSHDALTYDGIPREAESVEEVAGVCQEHALEATIYDEPGFVRGWAHRDGSWRLA